MTAQPPLARTRSTVSRWVTRCSICTQTIPAGLRHASRGGYRICRACLADEEKFQTRQDES